MTNIHTNYDLVHAYFYDYRFRTHLKRVQALTQTTQPKSITPQRAIASSTVKMRHKVKSLKKFKVKRRPIRVKVKRLKLKQKNQMRALL